MSALAPVVHARVLRFAGHAYSPWAGHGRRKYSEGNTIDGAAATVCGLPLQAVEDARQASTTTNADGCKLPDFATLRSPKSSARLYVTCPACLRGIGIQPKEK